MNILPRPLLIILLTGLFSLAAAQDLHAAKRIGVIMTGDIPYYEAIHETFVSELHKKFDGSEEIEIILQKPFPDPIAWSNAARKLIAFDVDLIVTYGSPAAHAVIHEKNRIPLVYAGFYEPDPSAFQGNNVTGCGFSVPLSSILRYFKRLKAITTFGVDFSAVEEDSVRQYETMRLIADQQGIKTEKINILSRADVPQLESKEFDVVFITGSALAHLWLDDIVSILDEKRIPAADIFSDDNESGVLITLYQPSKAQGKMAAEMAQQVLLGTKPSKITPHIFRETELVFNLVEAKRLGIDFPIHLLIEATRVIE